MARTKNQEARREQLLDAALHVINERGLASLRIRDVAAEAGVSTGTVHYYFDDVRGLLEKVHERASARFFQDRLTIVSTTPDARDKMLAMIAGGLPATADDELVVALYELTSYLRFRDEHAALLTALFDKQVALYLAVLEVGVAQGHFRLNAPALDIAQNLVALEDAYGLHIITRNRSVPPPRAAELIYTFARTATDCAAIVPPVEVDPPSQSQPEARHG